MTPQLQQAIRLLQLSAMELSTEIQEALESNMMLELADGEADAGDTDYPRDTETRGDADSEAPLEIGGGDPGDDEPAPPAADIPEELPVDAEWDEIYDSLLGPRATASQRDDEGSEYERAAAGVRSLAEHLLWQINLLPLSDIDRTIAAAMSTHSMPTVISAPASTTPRNPVRGRWRRAGSRRDRCRTQAGPGPRSGRRRGARFARMSAAATRTARAHYPLAQRSAPLLPRLPRSARLTRLQPADAQAQAGA